MQWINIRRYPIARGGGWQINCLWCPGVTITTMNAYVQHMNVRAQCHCPRALRVCLSVYPYVRSSVRAFVSRPPPYKNAPMWKTQPAEDPRGEGFSLKARWFYYELSCNYPGAGGGRGVRIDHWLVVNYTARTRHRRAPQLCVVEG